ncbi:Amuc_1098 family type IV pilus outer membrane protein [Luteolibacter marinus]|uniref:Amuc_1098 family type IV pilus outer membrane protein n=1 Tax=Luteolibacter marinus TaxID=2776705 RepID=UPI001866BA6C|nr:Amuc_1098 family type IV pilus outer membrane protein [Luteolibacter marinus]
MPINDRLTSNFVSRARLLALAPATCLLLSQPLPAQQASNLAQAELQRRAANAAEAQELLIKGDEAYEAGRWSDAVEAYTGARELLPDAPATAAQRKAATERLVQATVERAREQRRLGDVSGAGETIDRVLDESVAPDDGSALAMREQLDDPIRTNPAATLDHTKDVEEVRNLLYRAEGFKDLGEYDQSFRTYEEVLRVDPTNKAARRGMEVIEQLRADYARAAYDEARASMLAQVDEAWELRVRPSAEVPADLVAGGSITNSRMLISNKMDRMILPIVDFDEVNIQEALDFLRAQSVDLDTFEVDPAQRGVNFVLDLGPSDSEPRQRTMATKINLQLRNVPLSQVLGYICEITRTVHVAHEYAVTIRPAGSDSSDMITRSYRVPPDFLTSGSAGSGDDGANDPFAADDGSEGLLARRLSAEEVLKQQGVSFPDGATANFNAGSSTLRIHNTSANHAMVEQIVEAAASTEPAMVLVEVKMLKTQKRVLEELGFDWLLGGYSLGGEGLTPGTQALTLTGGSDNPGNLADIALPSGEFFRRAITTGNRSGGEAIASDSIDALLLEYSTGFGASTSRAPGVLWANAVVNNSNLTMLMRGLDQKTGVDLVVSPSTATRSGQQSTIEVIREFIYPTEYEPPELPNTVGGGGLVDLDTGEVFNEDLGQTPITPATPTSFETREVGVILDVLPTVSADRHYIDIVLKPSVTDFDGFINYGTPILGDAPQSLGGFATSFTGGSRVVLTSNEILMPVFSTMRTETNLTIADGATLIIGGMLQEKIQKVEDKTPILGDLPLIGRMFQSDVYSPVKTAIVFFVTVKVVDPTGRPFRDN